MTEDERQDLKAENAILRACLYLAARALKDYHDSRHVKTDDGRLTLTVPESLKTKAGDTLAKAQEILKNDEHGRGR